MPRLSYDAILLLAHLPAGEQLTIESIAISVFNGYNPEQPDVPTQVALLRAKRAAQIAVADQKAVALPDKRTMRAILSTDDTGGSLRAQFLMNLVVRGNADRRQADRRTTDATHDDEQRSGERRSNQNGRVPPLRIPRTYTKREPPAQTAQEKAPGLAAIVNAPPSDTSWDKFDIIASYASPFDVLKNRNKP